MKLLKILVVSIVTAVLASGCIVVDLKGCSNETVKGSGKVISEQRQVPEFKTVKLKGFGKVALTIGEQHSVEIRTDDNIMPLIETDVANGNLVISQGNYNLKPTTLEFAITVAHLEGVAISGSGDISGKSRFVSDDFFAKISGSGNMALELDVANLETGICKKRFAQGQRLG
jgi:hypothetical protein